MTEQYHGQKLAFELMALAPIIQQVSIGDEAERRTAVTAALGASIASAVNALDMTQNEVIHALLLTVAAALVFPDKGLQPDDDLEMSHAALSDYVGLLTHLALDGKTPGFPTGPTIN
jgi:hypothetical protein